jgi:hypothetical protein
MVVGIRLAFSRLVLGVECRKCGSCQKGQKVLHRAEFCRK